MGTGGAEASSRLAPYDALRFISVTGIICWHAALPYGSDFQWFGFQGRSSHAMDVAIWGSVGFAIQLFFVISGYFTARSLANVGVLTTARRRLRRLVLPFVCALVVFNAFVAVMVARTGSGSSRDPIGLFFGDFGLYHLWFVYYLALITAGSLVWAALVTHRGGGPRTSGDGQDRVWLVGPGGIVVLALASAAAIFQLNGVGNAILRDPSLLASPIKTFVPMPALLVYYTLFFGFGWMLSKSPAVTAKLGRNGVLLLALGLALRVLSFFVLKTPDRSVAFSFGMDVLTSLYTWCVVLGMIGVAQHLFRRDGVVLQFLSGASYWNYLAHLIPVLAIQRLIYGLDLPILQSYLFLVILSNAVLLLSYAVLVRATPLGVLMGEPARRAFPRSFPRRAPGVAAPSVAKD